MQRRSVEARLDTQQHAAKEPTAPQAVSMVPARSGFGTKGSECVIRANHFLVELGDKDPYQYAVTITPEVISKTTRRVILKTLSYLYKQSHLGNMVLAYDGNKSAFTAGPLPFVSKEFVVKHTDNHGHEKEFKVNIKFASIKDVHNLKNFLTRRQHDNPQETIEALNVVLKAATIVGRKISGRSLCSNSYGKGVLGDGTQYWKGYYQSLRPTQMGLSLNIDVSARAFYEPNVVTKFVADFLGRDLKMPLTDEECIKVNRALRGVRVDVRHGAYMRIYKVQALTVKQTSQLMFSVNATGATMSVVEYFKEKYKIDLDFAHLPAIQAGTDAKPIYLPMEICSIVGGQRYGLKLNEKQVTALLRVTCQEPEVKKESIMTIMERNNYNMQELVNKEFGMYVREQMTRVDARVLPPPLLKYKGSGADSEVNPSDGQWKWTSQNMIDGASVTHWAVANFSGYSEGDAWRLIRGVVCMCVLKGMDFQYRRSLIPMYNSAPENNIEKALVEIQSRCNKQLEVVDPGRSLQLLLVILPQEDKGAYSKIKRICETQLGIVSQCCKPQYVMSCHMQYFENIALKINVKLGGRNMVLADVVDKSLPCITDCSTIIFGADVTHPSPGDDSSPSIAAVVASMDWPQVTKYKALVSAQPHRQEMIEDLYSTTTDARGNVVHSGLIRELLNSFITLNGGQKPQRIIFYRDGVSEGQFSQVLMIEMDKIRKACASLEDGYLPPVTFILVQKRHRTRFFPLMSSGNIPPGTVVDTTICHPTEFDFYLCSHAGIKGTSRPTHYRVLHNENMFTADELQHLTNSLCYTYQRCTRSVSIVPPAYYAHLAASRARCYMEGDSASSHGGVRERATRERVAEVRSVPVIHDNLKSVMYYC